MNTKYFTLAVAACALTASTPRVAVGAPQLGTAAYSDQYGRHTLETEEDSFYNSYVKGRLRIGVSFTSSSMDKTDAGAGNYFLGNLNKLKEEDTGGVGLNIRYDFCDYVGVLFANDMHTEVSAWNHGGESTDGTLEIDGMLLQLTVQYPIRFGDLGFSITPYVGVGYTDISTKWSYAPWWHYGWSSPADYKKYGNGSKTPRNGYSRWMVPEAPSNAFTFTVGVSFEMLEHLDVDLFYRNVAVDDVNAKFHVYNENGTVMREGAFPAEFSTRFATSSNP